MAGMLPDEIQQYMDLQKQKRFDRIEALGRAVAKKRDDAIKGRSGSGIEEEWAEAEDQYQGVDDANRSESKAYKPLSSNGSAIIPRRDPSRSSVFMNITRPYTDSAVAKVTDMMLPNDDPNWSIKPTPIPQLEELAKLQPQVSPQAPGSPPGATPPGSMPGAPNPLAQAVEQAVQVMAQAKQQAERASTQIEDWLVECQYHSEVRKSFEDCGRLGTGILKGPVPVKMRRNRVQQTEQGVGMVIEMEIAPCTKRIDPWNLFPDPACGEDIHNGQYIVERDYITARQLRDLKGVPGYTVEAIDKVLEEGPGKQNTDGRSPHEVQTLDNDKFEIFYFHGYIDREDMEAMCCDMDGKTADAVPAIVTLINDTPIKASLNPLDSGEFPYDLMPWQRRAGSPFGIGIPMQIRAAQRIINGATRNMMDNAGLSGGPQLVIRRNVIEPADKTWSITPRKIWFAREDADVRTVADALTTINIPSMQGDLMAIIQFALKMAEDVTGLPMIMQGQMGKAPDTVGGMNILQNNASTVLRRIARTFDDCVTEPHIRRYYEWLMMYGPDEAKGDFTIDARGSSALVERSLADQAILQLGALVANPAFGIDPEKWIKEALAAQRIDPSKILMDDEKKAAMAQQPPPVAPQVEAAKIRAEADMQKTQMSLQAETQVDMARIKRDVDRDTIYVQAETQRTAAEHDARMAEMGMRRELAMLEYANKQKITLDQLKTDLARDAMKLRVQRELAAADREVTQVATPAVEPVGRAPAGQAFQR